MFPGWEQNPGITEIAVKLLNRPILEEFKLRHRDVSDQIDAWVKEAQDATWKDSHEMRRRYGSADPLGDGRTVFNLKGNKYRLGVRISYQNQVIRIEKIGTHQEYADWKW